MRLTKYKYNDKTGAYERKVWWLESRILGRNSTVKRWFRRVLNNREERQILNRFYKKKLK